MHSLSTTRLDGNPYFSVFRAKYREELTMKEVVISGASRTPMGGFQGVFDGVSASELGGVAIKAALKGAGVKRDRHRRVRPDFTRDWAKMCLQRRSTRCAVRACAAP